MSDYCRQCSIDIFGEDNGELRGLSGAEDTEKGLYPVVICEGCGVVQVDHEGSCVSPDCVHRHGVTNPKPCYKV